MFILKETCPFSYFETQTLLERNYLIYILCTFVISKLKNKFITLIGHRKYYWKFYYVNLDRDMHMFKKSVIIGKLS